VATVVETCSRVQHKYGLHARPAALIVQVASRYQSHILLAKDGLEVDGKSIIGVMMLAAEQGSIVSIRAEGPDEQEAARELAEVVAQNFGEI
jgi:phosphocarrier protein